MLYEVFQSTFVVVVAVDACLIGIVVISFSERTKAGAPGFPG